MFIAIAWEELIPSFAQQSVAVHCVPPSYKTGLIMLFIVKSVDTQTLFHMLSAPLTQRTNRFDDLVTFAFRPILLKL